MALQGFTLLARLETEGQPQLDQGLGNPHGVCPTVIRKATGYQVAAEHMRWWERS